MKRFTLLVAGVLCALPTVFVKAQPAEAPPSTVPTSGKTVPAKGVTEITLQRIPGFVRQPAPVYKVTFHASGRVVALMGTTESRKTYEGTIGDRDFKHLARFVEQSKFFELKPLYSTNVSDLGTVVTSVVKDGKRKDVRDYAYQGPTNLWSIEKVLTGLASEMKWKEVTPAPQPKPANPNER